jgi:purine nucleosidase
MEKVLLDTDIGSDIDDAVALAYLLANPRCELLGITTVTGQAVQRARLASALCCAAGKAVPIFPGVEDPLIVPPGQIAAPQASALTRWEHQENFPKGEAIDFLASVIRANPGQVTLLSIGPLTNVALLFSLHPEVPGLLKGLVSMCGMYGNDWAIPGYGPAESNAIRDPHAAAIVYARPVKRHRSIGLDATCRVTMDAEKVRSRFTADLLKPVLDFAGVWFERERRIVFHDPLAAAVIFDEGVCSFERGRVELELTSSRLSGMTYWSKDPGGPHEVATRVDAARFFEEYFSVFETAVKGE